MNITAELMPVASVTPQDAELFSGWAWERREQTCFDPDTLSYPRSCMAKASDGDGSFLFLPFHPVLMFESLITKPGVSASKTALGMFRIGEQAEAIARQTGHGEAYFITNDADEVALTQKRGWVVVMQDAEKKLWLMKRKFPKEGQ